MMNFKEMTQHPLFLKTFGGLTKGYYLRQLVFGAVIGGLLLGLPLSLEEEITVGFALFVIVSTVLYPYSRFVYETVVNFIVGDHLFILPAVILLVTKFITMLLCWAFAVFIAPVGLGGLYVYFTLQEKKLQQAEN